MVLLFLGSFAALLFVLWQIVVGGATRDTGVPPTPLAIPPGAVTYPSYAEFEKAPRKPGEPIVVIVTEQELNSRIVAGMAKAPDFPFKNVVARIRDDRIDFTGSIRAAGLDLSPRVGLRPMASNTRLAYELRSIDLGPVPVPPVANKTIADTIDRELEKARLTEGFLLDAVQAREGAVTLVMRAR